MSEAIPSTFAARSSRHPLVVHGVVADVAGAVLALEPTDPVLQARVPGIAQGRARRSSRAYGWNTSPLGSANRGSITGRSSTAGTRQGSEEFCRKLSDSTITGVR